MGHFNGVKVFPLNAICVLFLWECGAIRTTCGTATSGTECPDNHILTVEYPCSREGGKNTTCYSSAALSLEADLVISPWFSSLWTALI
ncbi:hypothetical protein NHX12_005845 [Muraenolepis orangiensis]|uniref:Secreted protein n=1 Tax=Muraenolepis orangiensis TaxID=630683 RepID=A0A9Q0DS66_9TELE|nr:hypothetical protein NHX12_005845 [Muraenolepis orangiensis]